MTSPMPTFQAAGTDPQPVAPHGGRRKRTYTCPDCGVPIQLYAREKMPDHNVHVIGRGRVMRATNQHCDGSGAVPEPTNPHA